MIKLNRDTIEIHGFTIIHAKRKTKRQRANFAPSFSGRRKIGKKSNTKKVIIVGKYNDPNFLILVKGREKSSMTRVIPYLNG